MLFGAFLAPILAILVFNSIVFVVVIRVLIKHSRKKYGSKDKNVINSVRRLLISSFGITFLFGMSWVFGVLTISSASEVFQYLFTIFTSMQGFFIFFFFCVLGKEARESWIQLLCRGRKTPWSTTSTSGQQKTPVSTSGISSGGTRTTRALSSTQRMLTLSSIYLRRPSDTPSVFSAGSRHSSETPSLGANSVSSIEMNTMDRTISNLHAIQEEQEEEEEDITTTPPPTSKEASSGKTRRNSNTESMQNLSLSGSVSNERSSVSPEKESFSVSPSQEPSTTDGDFEVLENPYADEHSD